MPLPHKPSLNNTKAQRRLPKISDSILLKSFMNGGIPIFSNQLLIYFTETASSLVKMMLNKEEHFSTVLTAIHEDMCAAALVAKYSRRIVRKSSWTTIDHKAYFLYCVQKDNSEQHRGIFLSRENLTENQQYQMIWSILNWGLHELAPNHVLRREKREACRNKPQDQRKRSKGASYEPHEDVAEFLKQEQEKKEEDEDYEPPETTPDIAGQFNTHHYYADDLAEAEASLDPRSPMQQGIQNEIDISIRSKENRKRLKESTAEFNNHITNSYEVMLTECGDAPYSFSFRWCRWHHMKSMKIGYIDARFLDEQERVLTMEALNEEDEVYRKAIFDKVRLLDVPFRLATEEDYERSLGHFQTLDNPRFQRQGYEQACKELGIPNAKAPRFNVMTPGLFFFFWQVVCMKAIHDFIKQGLRVMLLCDAMGLGKTF